MRVKQTDNYPTWYKIFDGEKDMGFIHYDPENTQWNMGYDGGPMKHAAYFDTLINVLHILSGKPITVK